MRKNEIETPIRGEIWRLKTYDRSEQLVLIIKSDTNLIEYYELTDKPFGNNDSQITFRDHIYYFTPGFPYRAKLTKVFRKAGYVGLDKVADIMKKFAKEYGIG